jgi:predicted SnoaL-like aldol condensation-catalyzing enzyme
MSGDPSKIDDAVATDFVNHTDQGDKKGPDSLKAMITTMKKMMGDMKMTLMKEVADDDYVFSEMEFTGTSNGEMGMPKGPYDRHGIEVVKFKDGKAIEHWEYMRNDDVMEMMKMMMPPPPAKDTMMHK